MRSANRSSHNVSEYERTNSGLVLASIGFLFIYMISLDDVVGSFLVLIQLPLLLSIGKKLSLNRPYFFTIYSYFQFSGIFGIQFIQFWKGIPPYDELLTRTRHTYLLFIFGLLLFLLLFNFVGGKVNQIGAPLREMKSLLIPLSLISIGLFAQITILLTANLSFTTLITNPEKTRSSLNISNTFVTLSSLAIPGILLLFQYCRVNKDFFGKFYLTVTGTIILYSLAGSRFRPTLLLLVLMINYHLHVRTFSKKAFYAIFGFAIAFLPLYGSYRYEKLYSSTVGSSQLINGFFAQLASEPFDLARSLDFFGPANPTYRQNFISEILGATKPFFPWIEVEEKVIFQAGILSRIFNNNSQGGLRISALGEAVIAFGVLGSLFLALIVSLFLLISKNLQMRGYTATSAMVFITLCNWLILGIVTLPIWIFYSFIVFIVELVMSDARFQQPVFSGFYKIKLKTKSNTD